MSDYCVGIDLGTTNTVCAVWRRGEASPSILSIRQPWDGFTAAGFRAEELLASALTVRDERIFVGFAARQLGRAGSPATFTSIKRHMGRHFVKHVGGVEWTPERVSGCILAVVRKQLEAQHRALPRRVVITVPASFGTEARRATLRAARWAGFDVKTVHLFDEPAAALLAQLQAGPPPRHERERHIIIDIGGGTLDVSLVDLSYEGGRTVADIVGRSRYNELAGDDFDLVLAGLLLQRYEQDTGQAMEDLRRHPGWTDLCVDLLLRAGEAKEEISRAITRNKLRWKQYDTVKQPVILTHTPDGRPWKTEINGKEMSLALRRFFTIHPDEQSRRDEHTFLKPIQECLTSAARVTGSDVDPKEIDHVWLAGGSALLPILGDTTYRFFDRQPRIVSRPLYDIAMGAAWRAGQMERYRSRPLELRERMFDGIYLETADGRFMELVGPWEEIPFRSRLHPDRPKTPPRFGQSMDVKLCTGLGPQDPLLTPLARRRVEFDRPVPANTPISVKVAVTQDREVDFTFEVTVDHRPLSGRVEVSAGTRMVEDRARLPPLDEINVPVDAGGRP